MVRSNRNLTRKGSTGKIRGVRRVRAHDMPTYWGSGQRR